MSSPSAGRYQVVSPEELERRRLVAARDRYRRVAEAIRGFESELAGACAAYGAMSQLSAPHVKEPRKASGSAAWERAADEMARELERANGALAEAIAQSRLALFVKQAQGISATLTEIPGSPEGPRSVGDLANPEQMINLLARLPANSTAGAVARCESLQQQWRQAKREADRERVLDALRLEVQQQRDRSDLIDANRRRIEALYRELDGLQGEAVETLRGLLRGTALDGPIPADLEERVQRVSEDANREEDRRFVLETVAGIFSELGYKVDDEFGTVVQRQGLLLGLPGSRAHGLLVRERGHRLLLNVVRQSAAGPRDARSDTAAEEHFCRDLPRMQEELAARGVELKMDRLDPPGTTPVQILSSPSRSEQRPRTQRPKERERDRS